MKVSIDKHARNILYLIPSKGWGTKERFAFKDMIIAKENGYNVFLCTYESTFWAKLALQLGIVVIPFKDHFFNRITFFHKHFSLKHIYQTAHLDIIHCYDFRFLFSLAIQVKAKNLTTLILTEVHALAKPFQRFWYRPIISRIDYLILLNKNLSADVQGNLGLPLKKIEYYGMGLKLPMVIENIDHVIDFLLYKDYFLAGTYLSFELADISTIMSLFSALKVLNEKKPGGVVSKLILISAVEFQAVALYPEIVQQVKEQGLEEDILFVTIQDIGKIIPFLNLWISNTSLEVIEDFAVFSIMMEVPALFPRNFCTRDFLEEYEGVGETYKLKDARELKDKWEKIILGQVVFKEKTRLYRYFIERENSYKSYRTQVLNLYSQSISKRIRMFNKN